MIDPLQPVPILQSTLRDAPWMHAATARLPGTLPVAPGDWLRIDDAYAAQMALRDRLIQSIPDQVLAMQPGAQAPASELLDLVIAELNARSDFQVREYQITRPDGECIDIDRENPLMTLGRLTQQDFCILQSDGTEHILTGAILCFPASWSLSEKYAKPLTTIHGPVTAYTPDIARRVQRLFDAVRPERPLWRVNLLLYDDAALFQPRRMSDRRVLPTGTAPFVRSERQCISRLPNSHAIVFSIHTRVVRRQNMPEQMQSDLASYLAENRR